jgi:hypothetical protein
MGLMEQAQIDANLITTNLIDFSTEFTITSPTNIVFVGKGLFIKHHLGIDTDGNAVNSKKASLTFAERSMLNYPLRNANLQVNLRSHKISVKDSTGLVANYMVREWFPDETIGLIVCILGDFE